MLDGTLARIILISIRLLNMKGIIAEKSLF